MKTITRGEAVEIIKAQGNLVFGVTFIKKDGGKREMACRREVKKGVTGKGMAYNPEDRGLLTVFEMSKGFRMINTKTLSSLRAGGVEYRVRQSKE